MPEKRMVGLIVGVILIAVVGAWFIFKALGLQPGMEFPKGKETLVRYYACSLAICTHGCDWLDPNIGGHPICLDNDTFTHECNEWCHDVCGEFGNCGDTDDTTRCCGPEYNLSVSLIGRPLFRGCHVCSVPAKVEAWSDIHNPYYVETEYWYRQRHPVVYIPGLQCPGSWTRVLYDKLVDEEGFPKIVGKYENSIIDKENCVKNAYSVHLTEDFPGQIKLNGSDELPVYQPGYVHQKYRKIGLGHIYVFPGDAYEKYGCSGDCECGVGIGRHGFDYCRFQGKINIWSDWADGGCADVFFNSTISGDWGFVIKCTDPINPNPPPNWCKQKITMDEINAGKTADYTIRITNNLGTGAKFRLTFPPGFNVVNPDPNDPDPNPNCVFWDGTEQITDPIFVDDEEPKDFTMKCAPTGTGTYHIAVDATTGGRTESTGNIDLVVADYKWWVEPTEKTQNIDGALSQTYTVHIKNYMGEITDFNLGVATKTISGGTLSCEFVANKDTITLNDNEYDWTGIICNKDKNTPTGEYQVTITVDVDGMDQRSTTRTLNVKTCKGNIRLEFEPWREYDKYSSGEQLTINATGLEGCSNRKVDISVGDPEVVIKHCGAGSWDGETCDTTDLNLKAGSPGKYTVYASIDKNKDEDTDDEGEITSRSFTINKPGLSDDAYYIKELSDDLDWCVDLGGQDLTVTCIKSSEAREYKTLVIDCNGDCRNIGSANQICRTKFGNWHAVSVDCEVIELWDESASEFTIYKRTFDDNIDWCVNDGDEDLTITCAPGGDPGYKVGIVECDGDCRNIGKSPNDICKDIGSKYAISVDCELIRLKKTGDDNRAFDMTWDSVNNYGWCEDSGGEDMTVTCKSLMPTEFVAILDCDEDDGSICNEGSPENICDNYIPFPGYKPLTVDCETVADPEPWDNNGKFDETMCRDCSSYWDSQTSYGMFPSSVCCPGTSDWYTSGPGYLSADPYVPCLIPDNCTNSGGYCPVWRCSITGSNLGMTYHNRNILVKDNKYTEMITWYSCDSDDDCGKGVYCQPNLDGAYCDSGVCKLPGVTERYGQFLYIDISSRGSGVIDGIPRPVYGIRIDGKHDNPDDVPLRVFLHTTGGWKFIDEIKPLKESHIIRADKYGERQWVADTILLAYDRHHTTEPRMYIDYVGLLTRNYITPYCTDGIGDFNRVVNDKEICYWDVDCPISGSDWTSKISTGVGPFKNVNLCDCDETETCGMGYCYIQDKEFCYYNIQCANGGWTNTGFAKCEEGQCTANGCV